MKYGIYFAYWTHEWCGDYKKFIDKIACLGFDVLEISCAALIKQYSADKDLFALRDYAKEKNVILTAGYGPAKDQNLSSPDKNVVNNAKAFFNDILLKLKKMDIKNLGGGLYSYWPADYSIPIDKKGDWERSVKNMKEIAKIAEDCDIMLGMEVLNRFEGYLLNTCEEALRYVEEVGSSKVGIMLDTFHMGIEEDSIPEAIRMAGSKLCHLHLGEQNRKVPGKGCLPWYEIGCALRDIKFNGAAVMEPFVLPGGTVGNDIKIWRELMPNATEEDLDASAKNALQFVKHVFEK